MGRGVIIGTSCLETKGETIGRREEHNKIKSVGGSKPGRQRKLEELAGNCPWLKVEGLILIIG